MKEKLTRKLLRLWRKIRPCPYSEMCPECYKCTLKVSSYPNGPDDYYNRWTCTECDFDCSE